MAPLAEASAQRMDLALSRLRVPAVEGTACSPTFGAGLSREFCDDEPAWDSLMTQFGASLIPPLLTPARTTGVRGFYVGLESFITGIDANEDYWRRGTEGDSMTTDRNRFVDGVLGWGRVSLRKGLPFGFELGANVGYLVNTSYWTLGVEVRWAIMEGFRVGQDGAGWLPDVAVRGAVQTLVGDSELNVTVPSVDLTISKPFVIGDVFWLTPYVSGQLSWIFADTELVDLTPERDQFTECDPDPMPPTDGSGSPPYCRGNPTDFNHSVVFDPVRSMRARLAVGAQARYEWFTLTGAFAFDLLTPHELDSSLPTALPRQWRVDIGAGLTY